MQTRKIHIGKLLLEKNFITEDQLNQAIAQHHATGQKLGHVLVDMQFVKEDELLNLLSEQLAIPFIHLQNYPLKPEIVSALPEFYARHFRAIVLKNDDSGCLLGMVDPQDIMAIDELSRILKTSIQVALVREDELLQSIDALYRRTSEISTYAEELSNEVGGNELTVAQLGEGSSASDAPVIKLLQSIFEDAVQVNASDVHIEPGEFELRIRQRIDGVLQEHIIKEKNVVHALTLRLKLIAGINITEKRLPQDGRFSMKIKGKRFDVRLSTLPVQFGESVVMRLLNQSGNLLNLGQIGMPENILVRLRQNISLPNGLLLITGPTGSGKTTTLYGALSELNKPEKKIITVEDPVEYRLPRINQVQIQTNIELTFARALRAILRQDPDIIMVGELRDQETAVIALRAAMTGHMVLSTLHTNDAISSTLRLIDMGAEPYLVASVLRGIIAQRLVRRICKNCMKDAELSVQEKSWITGISDTALASQHYKIGVGCNYCHHTGYKGQVGVFEYLEWSNELAEALRKNDTDEFVRVAHRQETFRPLALSGVDLAIKGLTTISEVMRIAGEGIYESDIVSSEHTTKPSAQ
jgi:MSHA biogenesis protein MshE